MNKLQVLTFMNILDHKNCTNEKIKSRRKKKIQSLKESSPIRATSSTRTYGVTVCFSIGSG